MTTQQLLLTLWRPGIAAPLICCAALGGYAFHFRRRHGVRATSFVLAAMTFFVALASPIGVLARGTLFSAHMLQHLLLMLAVPPLALLGIPRSHDATSRERRGVGVAGPWLGGVGAMWLWHAPTLCNAAGSIAAVQWAQTGSLLGLGLFFWYPVLAPRLSARLPVFTAVFYLFAACVACTILGIMVTLSPVEVCSVYAQPVDALGVLPLVRDGWGLTPKADQEIGGLLMWVPACFVYTTSILATLARYYREEPAAAHALEGAE